MKKNQRLKNSLQTSLQRTISRKVETLLSTSKPRVENPVLKASKVWAIVSNQLQEILDENIYQRWFKKAVPLVLSKNILIIQTPCQFSSHWITTHYQELIDTLLSFQDEKMTSFFIPANSNKV